MSRCVKHNLVSICFCDIIAVSGINGDSIMAEFIVHGIVNGQEVSQCNNQSRVFCEAFYTNDKGIKKDVRRLVGNRMAYSYIIYEEPNRKFLSYVGRTGSYFGMTLIFENKQVINPDALFEVLEATYNNYVKDKVIQDKNSGPRKWLYPTLTDSNDTVATYIGKGFEQILKQNPGLLKYQSLPPLQQERIY